MSSLATPVRARRALSIEGCAVVTSDPHGTEYEIGHVVMEHGRIRTVGPGPAPPVAGARKIDGTGCLATPGLVNVHHHLYQWATRGHATGAGLIEFLEALYPVWARIDADLVRHTTAAGLAWLAMSGCSTSADHHEIFPEGAGDLLAAEIGEAARIGLRLHACRGAMDLGRSRGGLPPDDLVENRNAIIAAMRAAITDFHDAADDAMVRVALAPCSPFSVSPQLMVETAALARDHGVRMHTHLAETDAEERYCRERFGVPPERYLERLDWLADDVWLANGARLSDRAVDTIAAGGAAVAHCPSANARLGAGIAPVRQMLDAGIAVGLGIGGAGVNESGSLVQELRQALYAARQRTGPSGLTAREALWMATAGGARCLGRADMLGSLEPGKVADLALWRLDGLGHIGIEDPVTALVFGPPAPLARLIVQGSEVVVENELRTADLAELTRRVDESSRRLAAKL